jgi:hypothetical protein
VQRHSPGNRGDTGQGQAGGGGRGGVKLTNKILVLA